MISSLELAKLCGVSQGTVDRALHDRPGIGAATKERILAVAAEHGYLPNPAALEMLHGKSDIVGVLIPMLNSVFYMDLIQEIKVALDTTGARLFVTPVTDATQAADALNDFAARKARAVILVAPPAGLTVPAHITGGTRVFNLLLPVTGTGVISLLPDEKAAGRTAAEYLVRKGHSRLLHATYTAATIPMVDRATGFTDTAMKTGAEVRVLTNDDDTAILAEIDSFKPTAVFCHNDWLALRVIRLLQQQGVRIPDDISVMGVDDSPTFNTIHPGLTTLAYPRKSIARAVAAVLDEKKRIPAVENLRVVERETVAEGYITRL